MNNSYYLTFGGPGLGIWNGMATQATDSLPAAIISIPMLKPRQRTDFLLGRNAAYLLVPFHKVRS